MCSDCVLLDAVFVCLTSVHHSANMSREQRNESPPGYQGIQFHNTSKGKAPCTYAVHPGNLGLTQLGKINVIHYINRIKEKSRISRWAEKNGGKIYNSLIKNTQETVGRVKSLNLTKDINTHQS